jgi:hypothetical protein
LRREVTWALASASLGIAIVLSLFGGTAGAADGAIRPLIGAGLAGLLAYGIARTRLSTDRALLASVVVVASFFLPRGLIAWGLLLSLPVVVLTGLRLIRSRTASLPEARAVAPGIAAACVALLVVTAIPTVGRFAHLLQPRPTYHATAAGPSIYVLLLDAYPRADSLAAMGIDNRQFLGALAVRGFDVYADATSNYSLTSLTLATMLNGQPAAALVPDPPDDKNAQQMLLSDAIDESAALGELHDAGYRLEALPGFVDGVRVTSDTGLGSPFLGDFERHVLENGAAAGILDLMAPDWIAGQYRARIRDLFATWPTLGSEGGSVIFGHVMLPHLPFVFDADGARPMPDCYPRCWFWSPWSEPFTVDAFAELLWPQLEWLNTQVLAAVDRLPPDAVIVLMGDHGSRVVFGPEALRTFLAARTPTHQRLFGEQPSPVQWFPRLLNTYAGTSMPEGPAEHLISLGTKPFPMIDMPP